MNIRRFIFISVISMVLILLVFLFSYQRYFSKQLATETEEHPTYSRIVKTEGDEIQIYKNKTWETMTFKGLELNAFTPGYEKFKTDVSKKEVLKWLEEIDELNVNLIKIPYIQPPNFYAAIYEYNLDKEEPIYLMHEVMLDEKAILKNYDAFDKEILKNIKKDLKKTINVIHGQALLFNNKRSHRGLYLKDVSKYNLGFIVGTNTNSEIVTLTSAKYKDKTSYKGEYFSVKDGNAFEVFIGEILDAGAKYEGKKYKQASLYSYLTSVETDSFEYKQESNLTKFARINIEKIIPVKTDNLFVSYKYYPGELEFLEYEYSEVIPEEPVFSPSIHKKHLARLNDFYELPLVISDTGISSSRARSKVDQINGFNRGGFSEKEQGQRIVTILDNIYTTGSAGAILGTWQDDWTRLMSSSLIQDYLDKNNSSYWHDLQSSDESFGLLKFEAGGKEEKIYLDGEFSDWDATEPILSEGKTKLKVRSDLTYLYLLIEQEKWSLTDDRLYVGMDLTPKSGSEKWEDKAEFSVPADFIVELAGYNESRIVVNSRYNLFNYLHKYYANIIEKEAKIPARDHDDFSAIYLLNRKKFDFKNRNQVEPPMYYETGKLIHGVDNPTNSEFNSQTDFNKQGDFVEMKIPWALINVNDPLAKKAFGDFYLDGISSQLNVKAINFSLNYQNDSVNHVTEEGSYVLETFKPTDYFSRKKESYQTVKNYWEAKPRIR